jgi:hypothetical protein
MALLNTFPLDARSGTAYGFEYLRAMLDVAPLQEGVIGANDFKVVPAVSTGQRVDVGAGYALIRGDTGVRNGLYLQINDATILNLAVPASNGTNPRLDQVILTVNDSNDLASGGDTPSLTVLAGTATAGATLDNRAGAAALPSNTVRLADVLVPAGSGTVTASNVRDRRPWARGARFSSQAFPSLNAVGTTYAAIVPSSGGAARLECSGVPMVAELGVSYVRGAGDNTFTIGLYSDGALYNGTNAERVQTIFGAASGYTQALDIKMDLVNALPAAGSHLFEWMQKATAAGSGNPSPPIHFAFYEDLRQNAANT